MASTNRGLLTAEGQRIRAPSLRIFAAGKKDKKKCSNEKEIRPQSCLAGFCWAFDALVELRSRPIAKTTELGWLNEQTREPSLENRKGGRPFARYSGRRIVESGRLDGGFLLIDPLPAVLKTTPLGIFNIAKDVANHQSGDWARILFVADLDERQYAELLDLSGVRKTEI